MGCLKLNIENPVSLKILNGGKSLVSKSGERSYCYGFQGQEKDDEIKGDGNSVNYEFRMHDPRIGRFFSIDPLAGKYPYNSPYAFSENRVIDGVELEGLEFYYAADGRFLGQIGEDRTVRVVNSTEIEQNVKWAVDRQKDGVTAEEKANFDYDSQFAKDNSTALDISYEELNVRAMLYTIRVCEGAGTMTEYDSQFGNNKFKGKDTDGDGKISKKEKYADHPRESITRWKKTSDAAGAYMIKSKTWDWKKKSTEDFSPVNQDKVAIRLMDYRGALGLVKQGQIKAAFVKLKNEWSSLPGASEQGQNEKQALDAFNKGISLEISRDSKIATPQGQLSY